VIVGNYDPAEFNNVYLGVLFVLVNFVIYFFFFTLIISLSDSRVIADMEFDGDVSYQDKAALISLYSYLLTEKPIRGHGRKYLMIATVKEHKNGSTEGGFRQGNSGAGDMGKAHAKLMKSMDKRFYNLQTRTEKQLKDIQDRLDTLGDSGLARGPVRK